MRIASYNIWNKDVLFKERIFELVKAIKDSNSDVVCLQEVRNEENRNLSQALAGLSAYPYFKFEYYPDSPDEGLAILSRYPFISEECIWETNTDVSNYCAVKVEIEHLDKKFSITNVHLNWRAEEIRIEQLKAVEEWLRGSKQENEILCGDFNDIRNSKTYGYLLNQGWQDTLTQEQMKDDYYKTFDLVDNPHLKEDEREKEKLEFDWIMRRGSMKIKAVNIFGRDKEKHKIIPSDHYGIYADIK